jgi:hypothetical protein
MQFRCTTTGRDPLGLAKLLEQFANEQWVADHYTPEQATEFLLDRFKRTVATGLEQIELRAVDDESDA